MRAAKYTAVPMVLICVGLLAGVALAEEGQDREIVVFGSGVLQQPPTILVFRVELGAVAPTAKEASDRAQERVEGFIEHFRRFGLKPNDWSQEATVARRPLRDEPNKLAFWATGILTVRLDEFGAAIDMLDQATELKASAIYFSYELDEPQLQYERALKRALADAQFKAETMAKEVGLTIGELLACEELTEPPLPPGSERPFIGSPPRVPSDNQGATVTREHTELRPHDIVTVATVRARFKLTE